MWEFMLNDTDSMEKSAEVPQKLIIELPSDPAIHCKKYLHRHIHCNTIHNSQAVERTCMSIGR